MIKRIICLSLLIIFVAVTGYYTVEVLVARANTQAIVDGYMNHIDITINQLSEKQVDILLAVEDPNFYLHKGVDFTTPGAGWTTITQGLAKRFYFADFKQGLMKIKQTLCALFALDPVVDKDTQLTLYINMMYFGNGVYGLKKAAEFYFGKKIDDLSEDEYISLIACIVSPEELNGLEHPDDNALRVKRIKKVMSGAYVPSSLFDITYEDADKVE